MAEGRSRLLSLPPKSEQRAELCCALALSHEERGEYAEAAELLSTIWAGPGARPDLAGLSAGTAATVLLRCGTLTGWLGSERQVEGWQEKAKDLLSESSRQAGDNYLLWAEAENGLAVCYWRNGAHEEARTVLLNVIARTGKDCYPGLKAAINLGMVERCKGSPDEALQLYREIGPMVEKHQSDSLKSLFHNELGCVLMQLGDSDRAIIELTAACVYFERCGHARFNAAAENNLGYLLTTVGELQDAHRHFEKAELLFSRVNDVLHLAQAKDCRALAYLAEKNYSAAEQASCESVELLERGDSYALLIDSLVTHAKSLSGLGRHDQALQEYVRAHGLAANHLGSERAAEIGIAIVGEVAGDLCLAGHITLDDALHLYEESIIRKALEQSDQKISAAGLRLGVSQQTFSNILGSRHEALHPDTNRGRPRRKGSVKRSAAVLKLHAKK